MITLHILKLLEDNGLGVIAIEADTPNADMYFEKFPNDRHGIYIVSRGATQTRGRLRTQAFDLYARDIDDLAGAVRLQAISDYIDGTYGTTCTLPIIEGFSEVQYKKVMIQMTSSISNVGTDATGRVIYSTSGLVTYSK